MKRRKKGRKEVGKAWDREAKEEVKVYAWGRYEEWVGACVTRNLYWEGINRWTLQKVNIQWNITVTSCHIIRLYS